MRRREDAAVTKTEQLANENIGLLSRSEIKHEEHPLSLNKTSVWNQYFQVLLFFSHSLIFAGEI